MGNSVNELMEQIGGRERLELASRCKGHEASVFYPGADQIELMARVLLAVLDAQEKPVAWISSGYFEILGRLKKHTAVEVGLFNSQRFDNDTPLFVTPPFASVPDGWKLVPIDSEVKPVFMPKPERLDGNGYGYYFDMDDVFRALDDANVRYLTVK